MRRRTYWAVGALVVAALAGSRASAQNLLANPGFEEPITYDGPPFVGSWEGFSGGAGASAGVGTSTPRSGAQVLELSIVNTDNTFAGTFQDVPNLTPGTEMTFTGFHRTTTSPLDLVAEVRIEWRNAGTDAEIARTPNLTPTPGSDYGPFALTAPVPAGADTARVVYAIQTFTGGPTNNGTIHLDDLSFAVVPEPSALAAAAAGLGALGLRRRRRRIA